MPVETIIADYIDHWRVLILFRDSLNSRVLFEVHFNINLN